MQVLIQKDFYNTPIFWCMEMFLKLETHLRHFPETQDKSSQDIKYHLSCQYQFPLANPGSREKHCSLTQIENNG